MGLRKRWCGWLALGMATWAGAAEPKLDALVAGNNAFALELYSELKSAEGNLFLSPYSISSALAMTYAGARGNTAAEMEKALHFGRGQAGTHPAFAALQARLAAAENQGNVRLAVANSLWPQAGYPFLPEYLKQVKDAYDADVAPLDFKGDVEGARQTINQWVARQTQEKIRDLIGRGGLDPLARLVLVNAVYFKGNWASPFKPEQTAPADFYVSPETTVPVPLMVQARKFAYAEFDGGQVVQLPYAGNGLSMLVVLPQEKDGLAALEAQLTPERLAEWRRQLHARAVCVYLPKFKMKWGTAALNGPLQALGIVDAFRDARADFSGMDGQPRWLYVGAVLHQAFVEVNEGGTEAAAATAVVMEARAMRPQAPPVEFRADHPFLFLIQEERTGAILFLGRLADPAKAE